MKHRTFYMHTRDGKPAEFIDNEIYHGMHGMKLATTLAHIRDEQRWAREYREARGVESKPVYGYVRVRVPCGEGE